MPPPDRLAGVHPDLEAKIQRLLTAMRVLGWPMIVTDGLRTDAEQQALYAKGRNTDGTTADAALIVTNCDGLEKRSNHQAHADGYGHAVDCTFVDPVKGLPRWKDSDPWPLYGAIAESLGLHWGGRWTSPVDRPHVELP
jgi:peptidoglycan L-alanyl-D-glutamate endopeptidase CwlK